MTPPAEPTPAQPADPAPRRPDAAPGTDRAPGPAADRNAPDARDGDTPADRQRRGADRAAQPVPSRPAGDTRGPAAPPPDALPAPPQQRRTPSYPGSTPRPTDPPHRPASAPHPSETPAPADPYPAPHDPYATPAAGPAQTPGAPPRHPGTAPYPGTPPTAAPPPAGTPPYQQPTPHQPHRQQGPAPLPPHPHPGHPTTGAGHPAPAPWQLPPPLPGPGAPGSVPGPAGYASVKPPHPDEPHPRPHPDEVTFKQRRAVVSNRQRRTDATAIGGLLLHLPNFLCSLLVIGLLSTLLGEFGLVLLGLWLLSGALIFHRPTEALIARRLLKLRHPTPQERTRLDPAWREVTIRAGVEGGRYELWVEENDHDLNAVAAAGHIVGVTRYALTHLPSAQLAAILAHELGHHVGGHAWSSLLGYWYALPGRLAWRLLRGLAAGVFRLPSCLATLGFLFLLLPLGAVAVATVSTFYGLPLLVLVVPYLLAAVARRAELRADRQAAGLGFAPMLVAVLQHGHAVEQHEKAVAQHQAAAYGRRLPEPGPLQRLLDTHPAYEERLHHLHPYLTPGR